MKDNKLYKVNEAAQLLGVSPLTVYRWLTDGTLHGIRLGRKLWRIPHSDIERLTQPETEHSEV
jgi:excisionase family DNA binding protein